jgi:hypothetical protein
VHYTTSCNTQSSAPEDRRDQRPKHVELTGIINKPLLLHLVGCLYYLYQLCTVKQISDSEIYLLIKYIKSVLWRVAKRLSCIQDEWCLKVKNNRSYSSNLPYAFMSYDLIKHKYNLYVYLYRSCTMLIRVRCREKHCRSPETSITMSYCSVSYPKNVKATKTRKEAAGAASSGGRMQGGGKEAKISILRKQV